MRPWNVVCTDRGQHASHKLGQVVGFSTDGLTCDLVQPVAVARSENLFGDTRAERRAARAQWEQRWATIAASAPPKASFRYRCQVCGRDVAVKQARMAAALNALRLSDATCREIDVSYLG